MRNCQICGEADRKGLFYGYDSRDMTLFECDGCKHRYVDSAQLNQAWFDKYYQNEYHISDTPAECWDRYSSLTSYLVQHTDEVLDVGGLDGFLHDHIAKTELQYKAVGVGADLGSKHKCILLSHTLEHVYDLREMMKRVTKALMIDGMLVVEIPIHIEYKAPKAYDYHFQHVNKFRVQDITRLFADFGLWVIDSCQLPDFREYQCWRISGRI